MLFRSVAISNLSEEQYFRDVHSSFGSIHGTVVHIFGAQQVWLTRWKGSSPKGLPTPDLFPSFAGLVEQWNVLRKEFDAFLAALNDDRLSQSLEFRNLKGELFSMPLWQQMQHLVNHSTYHRGQVALMLRQLGIAPPGTDLITFYLLKSQ